MTLFLTLCLNSGISFSVIGLCSVLGLWFCLVLKYKSKIVKPIPNTDKIVVNESFGSQELESVSFSSSSSLCSCFFKASLAILFFSANFLPAATFRGSLILLVVDCAEVDFVYVI